MDKMICNCNQVSETEIKELLISGKAKNADDIEKLTGASDDCGRCRRNLEFFIRKTLASHSFEAQNTVRDGNNPVYNPK